MSISLITKDQLARTCGNCEHRRKDWCRITRQPVRLDQAGCWWWSQVIRVSGGELRRESVITTDISLSGKVEKLARNAGSSSHTWT